MGPKVKPKEAAQPGNIQKSSLRSWMFSPKKTPSDTVQSAMAGKTSGGSAESIVGTELERDGELTSDNRPQPVSTTESVSSEQSTYLSAMEARLMKAFDKLDKKIDTIDKTTKDMKVELENRLDKVESKLGANTKKLGDIEGSVNYAHKDIGELKEKMVAVEKDARNLRDKFHDAQKKNKELEKEVRDVKREMAEGLNVLERRTRDYNIRLRGVAAEKLSNVSDYRVLVAEILVNNELVPTQEVSEVRDEMEIAHPLGKPIDGKVNIIAKFYSRPYRESVVRRAKAKKDFDDVGKVTEDLTKADMDRKRRAFPQMQRAFEQGQRVRFQKGKLIIEGREVPIATD